MSSSFFGDAVHTVLPYIQSKINKNNGQYPGISRQTLQQEFDWALETFGNLPVLRGIETMTPEVRVQLIQYWWYVIRLLRLADYFWIEWYPKRGRPNPDLILYREGWYHIVDLKTLTGHQLPPVQLLLGRKALGRLRGQIKESATYIRNIEGREVRLLGYGLFFMVDMPTAEPHWVDVEIAPPPT